MGIDRMRGERQRFGGGFDSPVLGDSTESFPAVDPRAGQSSFSRVRPGDGNESFPPSRPRTDEDAFRLFPPVRRTGNQPDPPATDEQD